MRIISGRYGGRRLQSVKGDWLRPTSDRNREFIFSYLGNWIADTCVLDLFAGTGALGIEAMSRGAGAVTFVDQMTAAVRVIERNLRDLDIEGQVYHREALSFLKFAAKKGMQYDLIFCDPPYRYQETELLMSMVMAGPLAPTGLFVFETGSREKLPRFEEWDIHKDKSMGDTRIIFFGMKNGRQNCDLSGIV